MSAHFETAVEPQEVANQYLQFESDHGAEYQHEYQKRRQNGRFRMVKEDITAGEPGVPERKLPVMNDTSHRHRRYSGEEIPVAAAPVVEPEQKRQGVEHGQKEKNGGGDEIGLFMRVDCH